MLILGNKFYNDAYSKEIVKDLYEKSKDVIDNKIYEKTMTSKEVDFLSPELLYLFNPNNRELCEKITINYYPVIFILTYNYCLKSNSFNLFKSHFNTLVNKSFFYFRKKVKEINCLTEVLFIKYISNALN